MITRIARKEFVEMSRDGRFRWASAIVLLLLLVALAMGWKQYAAVRAQHTAAQQASRRQWVNQGEKNPHSAAHYGVYAFKPKMSLALVDTGLDPYTGVAVWLEAHYQNPFRYRPAEDATAVQRFGELTAATVLQLLLPLLIILLTFSAFAGEREQGTLRQLLSLGVSRRDLAAGKSLGVAAALALLLVPATAVGVLALALASENGELASAAPRLLWMGLAYLLYFGAFICLSLMVSALASSSRLALVALLGFWIVNGLVVPRLASDLSERLYPAPTAIAFWKAVNDDLRNGIDGHNPADRRAEELKRRVLAEYGVEKVEDLPVNFAGISMQAGEEHGNEVYDAHYGRLWEIYRRQERIHKSGALAAPLLAVRALSMGLAGTDFAQHRDFATAAESYRRQLNKMMNDDFADNAGKADFAYFADASLWSRVPDFAYTAPGTGWVLGNHLGSLFTLVLWFLLTAAGAVWAARRMRL